MIGGRMEASSQVPDAILKPVEKFEFYHAAYKRGQWNETQVERECVDPFFRMPGWDVDNTQGNSELYIEVIPEDPIRIRGSTVYRLYLPDRWLPQIHWGSQETGREHQGRLRSCPPNPSLCLERSSKDRIIIHL
jgi:hypothetical protein